MRIIPIGEMIAADIQDANLASRLMMSALRQLPKRGMKTLFYALGTST